MKFLDLKHAVLIAIHNDILLPGEEAADQARPSDSLPATADRQYPLRAEICIIGRDSKVCQICVPRGRTDISRVHATIKRHGSYHILEDNSRYGTFVNNQKIAGSWELKPGDVLGFANSREMLVFEDPTQAIEPLVEPLTEREREVLQLVAVGKSNQEIADALHIAVDTVKTRLKTAFQKLNVDNRTEAVYAAVRRRLL
jgi:DNA-binding CsgD family transcriptional regulator